jgi:hypothetical protein
VEGNFNLILDTADKNNAMMNMGMMDRSLRLVNDLELKEQ